MRLCFTRRLSVCLSVCLSVINFMYKLMIGYSWNFATDTYVDEENWLNFGRHPHLDPEGIRWRILQHCKIKHFSTIWLVFFVQLTGSSWKFYRRCIFWKSNEFGPDSRCWRSVSAHVNHSFINMEFTRQQSTLINPSNTHEGWKRRLTADFLSLLAVSWVKLP